ncbi:acetyl-CoA hydrolase/transferase C-terminal domain-containing protein [Microbulbifer bruguierae]|uniref:Acetyl-CoA hydrolase/transferase C-terminal domain-containing protein n=1 Tax=Microbulbifer bruguierae TaxID=3029061 RepID=A0ABY8NDS0_9GAMM|nr:acetyl-CoA hydrolase/transferase C-terminal domain-containing protein [Microbulbifer bruguierae]WGL17048.1 acetyl-CoA hydrolase/transferase C-terminal domain-containing protein [Microbulbifer bruguierae]
MAQADTFSTAEACVDAVLAKVGKRVVLGLPLAIGKANHFVNAIYARAERDPEISLTIFTALTLERPSASSELQRRFVQPLLDRLYSDYQDLAYNQARRKGLLPKNVEVCEFFMQPGSFLHSPSAQQSYVSANYTHVPRDLLDRGVNVVAQMVSPAPDDSGDFSLSSNPDLTLPLVALAQASDYPHITMVAEVNPQLPFLGGDARVGRKLFDFILEGDTFDCQIFPAPNPPVQLTEYALAFHIAGLIKDGGTLQIGIGALGDAICHVLRLRHGNNRDYREILQSLHGDGEHRLCKLPLELGVFENGLYGASEMVTEGFLHLRRAGVLKREVCGDASLQQLLNAGKVSDVVDEKLLIALREAGRVQCPLREEDTKFLQAMGIVDPSYSWRGHKFLDQNGELEECDLHSSGGRKKLLGACAGRKLPGTWLHGGFYLGSGAMYKALRELPAGEMAGINMTAIDFINELQQDRALKIAQRQHARFVNSAMMVTLNGAVISDGLENAQVVSGVGGQYNFVAMAHELPGARSIITLPSTRQSAGHIRSNLVWEYPHCTIPRHLRDIVVTEYGVADLRGKCDRDVIVALLCITDSRFQQELLEKAKSAHKVEGGYEIPAEFTNNTPERIRSVFQQGHRRQLLPYYPLGTDLTREEAQLAIGLKALKEEGRKIWELWPLLRRGRKVCKSQAPEYRDIHACLERMEFEYSDTFEHRLEAYLVAGSLLLNLDNDRLLGDVTDPTAAE